MDRRAFLGTVAGGILVTPTIVEAQQPAKIYRIGWLSLGHPWPVPEFRRQLNELGWVEGKNISIEERWADNKPDRLSALAAELVELKVDVIVTHSTPAALAAKMSTALIPIVMAGADSPVERGLVTNLRRPGENVTGFTHNPGLEFRQKLVQLLKEAAPSVSRVAVLWSLGEERDLAQVRIIAPSLGLSVVDAGASMPEQVPLALAAALRTGADGVLVTPSPVNDSRRQTIVDFALANRLPSVFGHKGFVRDGGLMSYWTDWQEVRRRSATYVDKVLKGVRPGDLPIEQPTKFELVINLKTAKTLGLRISRSLRLGADELIQ